MVTVNISATNHFHSAAATELVNLKLISLALSGKSVEFTTVTAMIDEMVTLLKAEHLGGSRRNI